MTTENTITKTMSIDEIKAELLSYAEKYCTVNFINLIREVLSDYRFFIAPGSFGHHHAYVGGLAHHTLEVTRVCVAAFNKDPKLDPDCLIGCAILHDCCKVHEYAIKVDCVNPKCEKTDYYRLIGHVAGGAMLVDRRIPGRLDAVHCLLAHHGKREWGSPIVPVSEEAKILSDADYLCSREDREIATKESNENTFYPAHAKHKLEYVKQSYGLDVYLGQPVIYRGRTGVVMADLGYYVGIQLDGESGTRTCHPSDEDLFYVNGSRKQ